MRPSFELDPGLIVRTARADGTERHTLPGLAPGEGAESRPSLDGLAADFFAAGDQAELEPVEEPELEEVEPRVRVVRTPEMDARRARFTRVVAAAVGGFAAFLAFGLVLNVAGAASRSPEAPVQAPAVVAAKPAPAPVVVAEKPALPGPASPKAAAQPAAEVKRAPKPVARPTANAERPVAAVAAPAPQPEAAPARAALPSVASFAARAGDPVKTASAPPTASFAN